MCAIAAAGGHLEVLQWAREQDCPWNHRTCMSAAAGGHLEVLKWAREHGCDWSVLTCHAAAQYGHLAAGAYTRSLFSSTKRFVWERFAFRGYIGGVYEVSVGVMGC
jgi:hypothetical protein